MDNLPEAQSNDRKPLPRAVVTLLWIVGVPAGIYATLSVWFGSRDGFVIWAVVVVVAGLLLVLVLRWMRFKTFAMYLATMFAVTIVVGGLLLVGPFLAPVWAKLTGAPPPASSAE